MLNHLSRFLAIKRLTCLSAVFLLTFAASAQVHKQPYTLLWRISGKDLKEPSYLFGTMHVKDKRVFGFSDSVMLAIQKCKSFALEVHPDSTTRAVFELFAKSDTAFDLHKMLNGEEYKKFAKKFEMRNGYKLREDMNPFLAQTMMEHRSDKPDDKESFIDAYLYGIARTMHKNIYGLENISNHLHLLFGSPEVTKKRLLGFLENSLGGEDNSEAMIKIYSSGNIDNVLSYINKYSTIDSVLIARNEVMASGIIRYSHQAPIFAAVGAAHLPGDNGIVSLLRRKGYTVEPVSATFTGVASKFHIDYNSMTWVTHKDDEQGYELDFPAEPIKTNIYSAPTLIFPDLTTGNFYGIYVVREGSSAYPANSRKIFSQVIHNLTAQQNDNIISRKDIVVDGLPGIDIITKKGLRYQRSELVVNNNILYYVYLGNRLSSLRADYANRFFSSFKTFKIPEKATASWISYKNDTGAFSTKLPGLPYKIEKRVPDPKTPDATIKLEIYSSMDTVGMTNYLLRYNDYPAGNYMANKQAMFNSLAQSFSDRSKVIGKPKIIWLDDYEGRELSLVFASGSHALMRVYVRGNRTYLLMKQNLRVNEKVDSRDPFFDSFSFTPYMPLKYVDYEPQNESYKIKLTSEPRIIKVPVSQYTGYLKSNNLVASTSPASGGSYTLEHYNISKYYRTTGTDSLYKLLTNSVVGYTDTLIKSDTVMINGKKALEVIAQNTESKDPRRIRLLIDGTDVFALESHLAKDELFNNESNTFFNSLERTNTSAPAYLTSSKAKMIADDLASADTTTYYAARSALSYYTFTSDELPEIYRALQAGHDDDTSYSSSRQKLINILATVNDKNTIGFLNDLYSKLENKDMLRAEILSTIPKVDSIRGYDLYLKLLTETQPLKTKNIYMIFRPLYDSLSYAAAHFKQLLPLLSDSTYKANLVNLSGSLVNENKPERLQLISDNFDRLTSGALEELVKYTARTDTDKNEYEINAYKYITLMNSIKGKPLTDKYTAYYLEHYPKGDFVAQAVTARIANHLNVEPRLVSRLLDSMNTRFDVMEAYDKEKQLARVPARYKTQSAFGKVSLYKFIVENDDDDTYGSPEKITLLGSFIDKGSIYYAYRFKQSQRDSLANFIGIAGPYKPGSPELNFNKYYAYTDYDTIKGTNWLKEAKALIPKLREQYELDKKEVPGAGKK